MLITCKITGLKIELPSYAGTSVTGVHPVLALPVSSLHRLAAKAESLSEQEIKLLFLAYLGRLPLVTIAEPIPLALINYTQAEAQLPLLVSASQSQFCKARIIPSLRLTPAAIEEGGLTGWLELLKEGITRGNINSLQPDDMTPEYLSAVSASRSRNNKAFKLMATWAIDQMLIRCPGFSDNGLKTLTQILFDKRATNLDFMQDLKGRLLDYLPENSVDNAFRKRNVIERLDDCIAEGLLVAAALGMKTQEELQEEVASIATTYTIDSVLNTAAAPAKKLQALAAITIGDTPAARTYTPEQIKTNPLLAKLASLGKLPTI